MHAGRRGSAVLRHPSFSSWLKKNYWRTCVEITFSKPWWLHCCVHHLFKSNKATILCCIIDCMEQKSTEGVGRSKNKSRSCSYKTRSSHTSTLWSVCVRSHLRCCSSFIHTKWIMLLFKKLWIFTLRHKQWGNADETLPDEHKLLLTSGGEFSGKAAFVLHRTCYCVFLLSTAACLICI